jgi:eukaryotic-like serine/threonine-protein kinase
VEAYAVQAMDHWQLKQPDTARGEIAKATQFAETKLPHPDSPDLGSEWREWVIARALVREADALIGNEAHQF